MCGNLGHVILRVHPKRLFESPTIINEEFARATLGADWQPIQTETESNETCHNALCRNAFAPFGIKLYGFLSHTVPELRCAALHIDARVLKSFDGGSNVPRVN